MSKFTITLAIMAFMIVTGPVLETKANFLTNFVGERLDILGRGLNFVKDAATGNLPEGQTFIGGAKDLIGEAVNMHTNNIKDIAAAVPVHVEVHGQYGTIPPGEIPKYGQQFG